MESLKDFAGRVHCVIQVLTEIKEERTLSRNSEIISSIRILDFYKDKILKSSFGYVNTFLLQTSIYDYHTVNLHNAFLEIRAKRTPRCSNEKATPRATVITY